MFYLISGWAIYHMIEYVLHSFSHNPKFPMMYQLHKNHHTIYYPPTQLLDNKPYKTGYTYYLADGTMTFGPPSILIMGSAYLINQEFFFKIIPNIILFAFLADYIHTNIHIKNSWLEKYDWFLRIRERHFIHHKYTTKNMNIIDMNLDKLIKTYKDKTIASNDNHNLNN